VNLIRIVIVDDHPIVRQGISSLLSNYDEFELVGEAENGVEGLQLIKMAQPDVTLLDISLPGESGIDILRDIRQQQPEAKVLMLTSYDDEDFVTDALRAGAQGYILKNVSDEMLVQSIKAVYRGERVLSPRVTEKVVKQLIEDKTKTTAPDLDLEEEEITILKLLCEGASNAEIAQSLYMSTTSVKRKLRLIFNKLNVQTRAQAAAEAVRRGLV